MRRAFGVLLSVPVLLLAVLLAGRGVPAHAERPAVLNVRIGDHGDKTRVVLEMTAAPDYRVTALDHPYRLAIDFPAMDWEAEDRAGPGVGLVGAHRHGASETGGLRVSIALRRPARVRSVFYLPQAADVPVRFVLDLEPTDADGFAAQMAGPPQRPPVPQTAAAAATLPPPAIEQPAALAPPARQGTAATSPLPVRPVAATVAPPLPLVPAAPSVPPSVVASLPPIPPAAAPPAPATPGAVPAEPPGAATPVASAERPTVVPALLAVPLPRPRPQQPHRVIAIDPGHGGIDPGATGISGIHEKTVTLAVARHLRQVLEASGRYRVVLTRADDIQLPLRERVQRARDAGADLFISLHADSIEDPSIRGLSVYTLSGVASDREAELLAARENRADALVGVALDPEDDLMASILIDLAQRQTHNESNSFARMLVSSLRHDTALLNHVHREAGFAVLKAPDVPSVLVELGYLSNRDDEQRLTGREHQQRLARGLARAIDAYFAWLGSVRRS